MSAPESSKNRFNFLQRRELSMPHTSFKKLIPGFIVASLPIVFLACTGKKIELPPEAPAIKPLSASSAIDVSSSNTAIAATRSDAPQQAASGTAASSANPASSAAQSETVNKVATAARATTTSNSLQVADSSVSITRVSGQVNSGKQGQASFKIAGHISKTVVQVGEKIRKGQVLAVLDETDALLRLKLAQNQFEQARVTFDQARKDMQREEQLKKEGATTQSNLERMSNALTAARINQSQAEIALKQAEKNMADTKLTAAFDGVVARRLKVEGEYVGVGAPVFELASMNELEVSLRVPENLIKKVRPGTQISL
ncbi:efflux RND transporter periplasmic adaptor subunit, partial [bacterium]|nr:efflux RND transporter periplasmic adaptor subunit [bacterium]